MRADHHDVAEQDNYPEVKVIHECAVQNEGGDIDCDCYELGCGDVGDGCFEPSEDFSQFFHVINSFTMYENAPPGRDKSDLYTL